MRRAIYIGRFQIFHLGHVDVIGQMAAADDVDEIVLVVGSPQYDHRTKSPAGPWSVNPFTREERIEMIERTLAAAPPAKPWRVLAVADCFPDHDAWCRRVLAELPAFEVLYSADAGERRLFSARGKLARDFERRFTFHAGAVRAWIARGEPWRHAVPAPAAEVLDRIDAGARLREMFARDAAATTAARQP